MKKIIIEHREVAYCDICGALCDYIRANQHGDKQYCALHEKIWGKGK